MGPGLGAPTLPDGDRPQHDPAQVLFQSGLNPENFALRKSALVGPDAFADLAGSLSSLTFSLVTQGKTVLYEPRMWVYSHRAQTSAALQTQVQQRAIARASYFAQGWLQQGAVPAGCRWAFFKESLGGLRWSMRCWLMDRAELRPFHAAQVTGAIAGLGQILSRGTQLFLAQPDSIAPAPQAANVTLALRLAEQSMQSPMAESPEASLGSDITFGPDIATVAKTPMAVCSVDIGQPLARLERLGEYERVRVFVTRQGTLLGSVDLENHHGPLGVEMLSQAIVKGLGPRLFSPLATVEQVLMGQVSDWLRPLASEPLQDGAIAPLPSSVQVSVILTTCDRPTDLRNCLRHLLAQVTPREVEIIVADNRPASGITPPIVAEFPGVKLVSEPRVGGSYGRNTAFCASTGEIVATVDDDVTVPPDWLEKLIAPMARPEVMVVTGNVLPRELETEAQRLYEDLYGGLSEGFEAFEVDGQWLSSFNYSPPVWDLGVSANSAFRASIFHHSEIGMMPEVLGPGTPVGGGEENYLIYRILKAGYTLVYEPSAYVWHRHRRTVPQLRYQIYRQMMGGTAYHLMLWTVDKDRRGLQQLTQSLPRYFAQRLLERVQGKHQVPWSFLWAEIAGAVSGVWGYRQSLQAVQRQGRSTPYVPVAERGNVTPSREPESSSYRRSSTQVISGSSAP
ncbi:MAG: glycosyltransferase family 2 protein [Synechococcales cyanobacterium CRU_2_2]|nr:glycosyltransferase family 2 protein [Synechococcales cyanobacterium CRU_2_2]